MRGIIGCLPSSRAILEEGAARGDVERLGVVNGGLVEGSRHVIRTGRGAACACSMADAL
jgi:hypothetical protein